MEIKVEEIIDELDANDGLDLYISGGEFSLTLFLNETQIIDLIFNLQRNLIQLSKVNKKKISMDKKWNRLFRKEGD